MDRGLRPLVAGPREGMRTEAFELVGRDVISDVARPYCLGQQHSDHFVQAENQRELASLRFPI